MVAQIRTKYIKYVNSNRLGEEVLEDNNLRQLAGLHAFSTVLALLA